MQLKEYFEIICILTVFNGRILAFLLQVDVTFSGIVRNIVILYII